MTKDARELLLNIVEGKAKDAQDTFGALMESKIGPLVEAKKVEVAAELFNGIDEDETEVEDEGKAE